MAMTFLEKTVAGLPVFELKSKIMGGGQPLALCDRLKELIHTGEKNILLDFS
ncbi:MAG: hypothetical protein ACE5IR_27030 [bacterium]